VRTQPSPIRHQTGSAAPEPAQYQRTLELAQPSRPTTRVLASGPGRSASCESWGTSSAAQASLPLLQCFWVRAESFSIGLATPFNPLGRPVVPGYLKRYPIPQAHIDPPPND
jgi:hypothetical protein